MGFFSNLMIAILGVVNPVLALAGSAVKYITSQAKTAGLCFILDLVSVGMPGGFVKDIMMGVVSDAIEASSLNSAVKSITPFNDIVLKCDHCTSYSHYYVKRSGNIICNKCLEKNIDDKIVQSDKIFLIKNSISSIHNELHGYNRSSLSTKYNDFEGKGTFPNLSSKFKNFKN